MNENETKIMETEMTNNEPEYVEESSGMSTGLAMAIGGALTLAAVAGAKKLKKLWDKRKLKKELSETIGTDNVIDISEDDVNDVEND